MSQPTNRSALTAFGRALVTVLGWRLVPAVALPILLGLTEGAGLVLLVPLLAEAGVDLGGGAPGRLADLIARTYAAIGLPVTLSSVLGAVALVSSTYAALTHWQLRLHPRLDRLLLTHYRLRLYEAFVRAGWVHTIRGRTSDRVHAVMTDVEHVSMLTYQAFTLLAGGTLLAVYLGFAVRLSAPLTLLVLAMGALLLWCQRSATARASRAAAAYTAGSIALHHAAAESLAGLKTVRSYGAEERTLARVRALDAQMARAYLNVTQGYAHTKLWFDAGSTVGLVLVLYVAVAVLQVSSATLVVLVLLFARLLPRVAHLQAGLQQLRAALPGFRRVLALLDDHTAASEPALSLPAPRLQREVRLDDVSFRYAQEGGDVLKGVTLAVPAGATTAIVGVSGAGKSTMADLLMALLAPSEGRILVDGVPLAPEAGADWRSRIGYVAQDPVLFNDTIRENLRWAAPDASDADLWAALDRAAADFVMALPEGLDTAIGDGGTRLSGGERQRLALARALLRQPSLLILDEATSSVDVEHEGRILQAIERLHGRVTIVVITHRLTTVRHADVIYVLERGQLVEWGSWGTLMARPHGRFRELTDAQHASGPPMAPESSSAAMPSARV